MSATLCAICTGIFASGHILEQEQPHHGSPDDFLGAARNGCYICRSVTNSPGWKSVTAQRPYQPAVSYLGPLRGSPPGWLRLSIECLADEIEGETKSRSESGSGSISDGAVDLHPLQDSAWGFVLQPVDGKDIRYVTNVGMLFVH